MDGYLSNMTQEQGYSPVGGYVQQQGNTGNVRTMTNYVSEDILTDLKAGDTFQGEIMSVNGQEVQLQLLNGQYMTAKLEAQMQLALGQILNFEVQSNQNSRIVLKPLYNNLLQLQVGEAALRAANLSVNEKSLQLVSLMIENGMSIDKNNLPKLYRQLVQHPQTPVSDIIRLNKLNIPITDNNLTQYTQYKNLEYKLTEGIQTTAKEITELFDQITDHTHTFQGVEINADAGAATGTEASPEVRYMDRILAFLLEEPFQEEELTRQTIPLPQDENTENLPDQMQNVTDKQQYGIQEEQVFIPDKQVPAQDGKTLVPDKGQTAEIKSKDSLFFQENGQTIPANSEKITVDSPKTVMEIDFPKLLGQLNTWLKETPQNKEKIYRMELFQNAVKEVLVRKWTLSPQDIGKEGKVEQFYRKLASQSARLSEIMQEASQDSTAGASARNIRNNLEFMHDLNQTFQYVQLPLHMSGREAHGELYVYTNKRNLARNDGTLTALLHLDMEQLGEMDIHISLETEKNILTTRFCLEEDVIGFMESHIEELTQRLTKAGYSSKTYVEARKSDKTVLESIEEQLPGGSTQLSYQAFDIKA